MKKIEMKKKIYIAVLVMFGIAFVVTSYNHTNSSLLLSSNVEALSEDKDGGNSGSDLRMICPNNNSDCTCMASCPSCKRLFEGTHYGRGAYMKGTCYCGHKFK